MSSSMSSVSTTKSPTKQPPHRHAWVPLKQQADEDIDEHDRDHSTSQDVKEEYDEDREEVHHDLTPSSAEVHHHRLHADSDDYLLNHDEDLHDNNDDAFLRHPISILRRRSFQSDEGIVEERTETPPGGRIASLVSSSFELDDEDDNEEEDEEEELNLRRYHHFQIDQNPISASINNKNTMIKNNWKSGSTIPPIHTISTSNNNNNNNNTPDSTKKWLRISNYKGQRLKAWWNIAWQTWIQIRQDDRRRRTERLLASPGWNHWDRIQFVFQTWCCDTTNRSMGVVVLGILIWGFTVWSVSSDDHRHPEEEQDNNYHRHYHVLKPDSKSALRRWLLGLGIPLLAMRLLWRPLYWYFRGRHVAAQRRARMEWYDHINQGIASSTSRYAYNVPKTSDQDVMDEDQGIGNSDCDHDDDHDENDAPKQHEPYQDYYVKGGHDEVNDSPQTALSIV